MIRGINRNVGLGGEVVRSLPFQSRRDEMVTVQKNSKPKEVAGK